VEESSVIWKVTVSGIVRKESSYELVLILSGYPGTDNRISRPLSVRSLSVRDEQRSLRKKGGYRRRTARSHLDAAARTKTREDQIRRTTGDLRTRVAKCIVADGGIYENLF